MRRGLIRALLALVALWLAQDAYFHTLNPIAARVRQAAAVRMREKHVHPLTYSEIPAIFREAVIATEDRRFWSDPGIDPIGIARSVVVDVERDGYVEGGSTLTQQLVDNTLLGKQKTLRRKLLQAWYAIGLYDTMSKQEVFTLYTNVVYFGHGAYGLYNACETYFGKPPWDCNAGELTLVAGLPNAPSAYDPLTHYALARSRQQVVLENMVDDGQLSAPEAQAIWREPIRLRAD
ncbi:biosynthetic peptidoglycan transglycosylase [Alicyclobacillus sendaiensis]|uniref:Biosynthetic peptidoglycan transglycosylase n=1 Tax=Alicyclobacillus sendaiensis PA2 TaxID=3029425 RepID=A0ABT6Y0X8_ALISE|nr:biosynthetic peptidoglycan transglycosylase [Alicyclobacillus sendaiensis]MDI9260865.1 biosynthetic peptidoglycan transglycosylase [Alicyclobacillus sendaiensis PA2]